MWPHLIILKSFLSREKNKLWRTRVIWLNLSIENPLNISCPWKFFFENLHSFFHFFLLQGHDKWQQHIPPSPRLGQWEAPCISFKRTRGHIRSSLPVGWKFERAALATVRVTIKKGKKEKKNNQERVYQRFCPKIQTVRVYSHDLKWHKAVFLHPKH